VKAGVEVVPDCAIDNLVSETNGISASLATHTPLLLFPLDRILQGIDLGRKHLNGMLGLAHLPTKQTFLICPLEFLGSIGYYLVLGTGSNDSLGRDRDRGQKVGNVGALGADEAKGFKVAPGNAYGAVVDNAAVGKDEHLVELVVNGVACLIHGGHDGPPILIGLGA
jgi:hypothetical protein